MKQAALGNRLIGKFGSRWSERGAESFEPPNLSTHFTTSRYRKRTEISSRRHAHNRLYLPPRLVPLASVRIAPEWNYAGNESPWLTQCCHRQPQVSIDSNNTL